MQPDPRQHISISRMTVPQSLSITRAIPRDKKGHPEFLGGLS
jgi:hypothetical protein